MESLEVKIDRPEPNRLILSYRLKGDVSAIELPPYGEAQRRDRLWQHTCFEAFLMQDAGPGYIELNVSPSTEWASYRFAGHRTGITDAEDVEPNRFGSKHSFWNARLLRWSRERSRFSFMVAWSIPDLAESRVNLTAVIEETSGRRSYWALAHPDGEPDFHHPDCFVLDLPPPA